jgi:REP element-mobilizing transposase RayT
MDETMPKEVAAEVTRPSRGQKGHLPRLAPEFYRGHAFVFWTHTIADRGTGWLDARSHAAFREILLHAAVREDLLCPIYTFMPDHVHFVWIGVAASSDQRSANTFFRTHFGPRLAPHRWQHQPHDHVLRDSERDHGAFGSTCHYIAENPVRKGLTVHTADWPFLGCVVPGYPAMHPLAEDFWPLFWRIHASACERGHVGKL